MVGVSKNIKAAIEDRLFVSHYNKRELARPVIGPAVSSPRPSSVSSTTPQPQEWEPLWPQCPVLDGGDRS
jgi:hypothetical protein